MKRKEDKKDNLAAYAEQVNSPYSSLMVNDNTLKENKVSFNESKVSKDKKESKKESADTP